MESDIDMVKTIIIGPGGMKGFIYLGALWKLEEINILRNITHIIGISIGSVIGALICCDYKIAYIIVSKINTQDSTDIYNLNYIILIYIIKNLLII